MREIEEERYRWRDEYRKGGKKESEQERREGKAQRA